MVADVHKRQVIENTHVGGSLCQEFCIVLSSSLNLQNELSIIFHSWKAVADHSIMTQQTYGHRLKLRV